MLLFFGGGHRQFYKAELCGRVIHTLGGFAVVVGLGPENVGDEGLRVAVVEREPTGLDLDHKFVAREEDVVCGGKRESVEERSVARGGFWIFETFAVAAAENVRGDH